MDRLIYTAYSGLAAAMTRQRVIASNMANAQTIGFRAERLQFVPVTIKGDGLEARAMNDGSVRTADMARGALTQTNNPLDVAVSGDNLLSVQAEDGSEAYTRRGDLSLGPGGVLQDGEGHLVIGQGGPITVPLGNTVTIGPDGAVLVQDPATPDAPPARLDRLKLADPKGSHIEKGLDGLFRVVGGGILPSDVAGQVSPGALEQSNVDSSKVLVEMIEAQRQFEMRTKMIATAREVDEGGAALMRLS